MSSSVIKDKKKQAEAAAETTEAPTTALEVQQPAGALATFEISDDDFGSGHEERRQEDQIVPMVLVLQTKSPQVEGCTDDSVKAGMLVNTLTGRIYDPKKQEIEIHVGGYHTRVCEWVPRDKGGGFRGERMPEDEEYAMARQKIMAEKGGKLVPRVPIANGNELIETLTLFGTIVVGDEVEAVAIPCTSTKLKQARAITQSLLGVRVRPDRGAPGAHLFRIRVTTELEKRPGGSSFNLRFRPAVDRGPGPKWFWNDTNDRSKGGYVATVTDQRDLLASMVPSSDYSAELAKAVWAGVKSGQMKADFEGQAKAGDAEDDGGYSREQADIDKVPI